MTRVLVVDDLEPNRYLQRTWLTRAGFDVVEAATGAEALAKVRDGVDVVVLDVNLPDVSGLDVCDRIKADPATAGVPVMHVSATSVDVTARASGLDRGADAYLVEPIAAEELVALVRSLARRRVAARAAERLSRLAAATVPLNRAESVGRLVESAAAGAADVFGRPAVAIAESETGRLVRAFVAGPDVQPVREQYDDPQLETSSGRVIYLPLEDVPPSWRRFLARAGSDVTRWFVWPLPQPSGRVTGALCVGVGDDALDPDGEALVGRLAEAFAVAVANLRAYRHEHETALTLQNALLPHRLPALPAADLAARYLAASHGVTVGGDFYDAFHTPDGALALVLGDVQGHSLHSATVMAEVRFVLRGYVLEGHPPERVLALVNDAFCHTHPDLTATVVLVVVEPHGGTARVANAGHLPPLLVHGGTAAFVEDRGLLLGLPGSRYPAREVALPAGSLLVLTTDGLLERRGTSLDESLAGLGDAVADVRDRDAAGVADGLVERFVQGPADDDVALVVLRRQGAVGPPVG